MTEPAHKTLAEALAAFQAEVPTLPKDGRNPHFGSRFTKLDTIREKIGPLLSKHGLTWQTFPCFGPNGEPALRYVLTHVGGDAQSDVMPLMLSKSTAQDLGSAITYARRYSVTAVLDLVADEDDDGNAASKQAAKTSENGAAEYVTPDDIAALQSAAKGLKPDKIKLAFTACGIPIPEPMVWNKVLRAKAPILAEALAKAER